MLPKSGTWKSVQYPEIDLTFEENRMDTIITMRALEDDVFLSFTGIGKI